MLLAFHTQLVFIYQVVVRTFIIFLYIYIFTNFILFIFLTETHSILFYKVHLNAYKAINVFLIVNSKNIVGR